MYKTVFVVAAVFVFVIQGALSDVKATENSITNETNSTSPTRNVTDPFSGKAVNIENTSAEKNQTVTTSTGTTNGASGAEICTLLFQITSLALVAKNVLL